MSLPPVMLTVDVVQLVTYLRNGDDGMAEVIKTYTYMLPEGPTIFRFAVPSEVVYDKFEDERPRGISAARAAMVKACIRSHTGAQLDAIFEKYPAAKHGLGIAVQTEAGASYDLVAGEVTAS